MLETREPVQVLGLLTEMTSDTANLLFKDLVVKPSLEFTLPRRGLSDTHSILSTTQNDEILLGSNGRAVQGSIGSVGLHDFEVIRINKLGGLVFRGCDEVRPIV